MTGAGAASGKPARDDIVRERGDRPGDPRDGPRRDPCRGEGGGEVEADLIEVGLTDSAAAVRLPHARPLVEIGTAERGGKELDLPALEFRHIRAGEEAGELRVSENSHVEVVHDRSER